VLCDTIVARRAASPGPLLLALDGRSGVGKSTVAQQVGARMAALVIDWRRQRALLTQLARGEPVTWQPYDWEADDGSLGRDMAARPAGVVILDGAYSARAELADLYGVRVLLDLPRHIRRARLLDREGERYRAEWEDRWAAAEDLYFEELMPSEAFDLVLDGT
jgi:uridine kinase